MCAALTWYSLLKEAAGDTTPVHQRLVSFWEGNSTQNFAEELFNNSLVSYIQLVNRGLIPEFKTSPASLLSRTMLSASTAMLPRKDFYDFKGLLEAHIGFDELETLVKPSSPVLLVGAANVLKGEFKKFNSRLGEIQVESILASAAVPSLFPAVRIGEDAYWDGLFSDNPPTDELINPEVVGMENLPDEIWVIRINPKTTKSVPDTPEEIVDRRNEMIGNESLFQNIQKIEMINYLIEQKAFTEAFLKKYHIKKPIKIRFVNMSQELEESLDYSSKLNRSADYLARTVSWKMVKNREK